MSHYSVAEGQQWVSNPAPLCPEPGVLTLLGHHVIRQRYHDYCPQTKFGEGNVFTGVCLSTGQGVGYPGHWRGHMVGVPPRHGTWIPYTLPKMGLGLPYPTSVRGTWIPNPLSASDI